MFCRWVGVAPSQLATAVLGFRKTHGSSLKSIDTKQNLGGIAEYEVPSTDENIRDETERILFPIGERRSWFGDITISEGSSAGQQRPFFNSHQDLPRFLKKNTTFNSISKGKSTIWQTVPGFLLNVSMHEYFTYYFEMGKEINWLFYFP